MGKKKSNAEALTEGILSVFANRDPNDAPENIGPTIQGMIEEAWGAEEAQKSGTLTIEEACKTMCASCRKEIPMHDGRSHLILKDANGPKQHQTAFCTAVALRRLEAK
jgi:hypothetical protein